MSVSVKAVIRVDDAVLLGENDRDEWELLGGRPEAGESFDSALIREVREESGLAVTIGERLLDEPFEVLPERWVRIVAFRCEVDDARRLTVSDEHRTIRFVPVGELVSLRLPAVYRRAIHEARP